jgi:uncharacterized protein
MSTIVSYIKRNAPAAFFAVTLALTGLATLLLGRDPAVLPFALVLVPTVAALTLAALTEGRQGIRDLLGRLLRWRVGLRWYAAVLAVPLLATLATVAVAVLLGAPSADLFGRLNAGALLVAAVVILPAFAEELGWRGYALPRMLEGRSPLASGLTIGILWAACHLPLFLPGQMYDGQSFWPLPLSIIALSLLLTWVFVNTAGSVLMSSLFHAASNAFVPLTWGIDPAQAWEWKAVMFAAAALVVVAVAGPDLRRGKAAQPGQAAVVGEPFAENA